MSAGTIPFKQATDASINATFSKNGVAFDLTGCSVSLRVKRNVNDAVALIDKSVTSHTDPTNGKTAIPITHIESNLPVRGYEYTLKMVDSNGTQRASSVGRFVIQPVV